MESVKIDRPIFSIIIPTYNTSIVLRQCIVSLFNQSIDKKCFEVIIVNDGGKDDISENLGALSNEFTIRYLYQEHKGPAAARNLGIRIQ